MGRRSSLHEDFVRVKIPMALEPFEVFFFSGSKLLKSIQRSKESLEIVQKQASSSLRYGYEGRCLDFAFVKTYMGLERIQNVPRTQTPFEQFDNKMSHEHRLHLSNLTMSHDARFHLQSNILVNKFEIHIGMISYLSYYTVLVCPASLNSLGILYVG